MLQSMAADPFIMHQGIYRTLLRAVSRPGEKCPLPPACGTDFENKAKQVLETLLDQEVTFSIAETRNMRLRGADVTGWTHSQQAPLPDADFLIVEGTGSNGTVLDLKRGTPEMPDQGATVIYFITEPPPAPPSSAAITITGPGVAPPGEKAFPALGLAAAEFQAIQEANQEFPMGVDCFFICPDATVIGLPRSIQIQEEL